MAVTIGSNIASLQAQRRLAATADSLSNSYSRLSSGTRITRASDDAASLAVADTLRSQRRMAGVALRNVNDGISFIALSDGALEQVGNVLTRMSELANQAASGTYSAAQRGALDAEAQALKSEVERIAWVSEFNSNTLIRYSYKYLMVQAGVDNSAMSRLSVGGFDVRPSSGLSVLELVSLVTSGTALSAMSSINTAITSVAGYRATFGAFESRLRSAANTLSIAGENMAAAESRIRDVDVASESAELTRLTILQRAGASVLAQANQAPALALQLLG